MPSPRHLALAAVASTALATAACQKSASAQEGVLTAVQTPIHSVPLSAPEKVRFTPRTLTSGSLRPAQSSMLGMAVPGTLERITVKRGQSVSSGSTLAVLDAAAAQAQVAQAQAGLAAAHAQLKMAEDGLRRLLALKDSQSIAQAQLDQASAQRDLADAQVRAAGAQVQQAQVYLRNHTLRAPFGGVVTRTPDGAGMMVGAGTPLFVLEDVSTLVLDTTVTQEEAAELRVGAKVSVTVPASGARADTAVLRLILPGVDPATNRVPVEVAVPNADGRFLSRAFARAEFAAGAERDALRVNSGALTQREGAFSLWVAARDGKAQAVPVRVLGQTGDAALVDPASFPQDVRVIDAPPLGLQDGAALPGAAP